MRLTGGAKPPCSGLPATRPGKPWAKRRPRPRPSPPPPREKAGRSASEQAEKGKPYEDDALFIYLWKRRYGTSDYKAGRIARYFDGKVANLIGYDELRPNYFMLNEIPARLREHAGRLAAAVADKAGARKDYERAALSADGIETLERDLSEREARAREIAAKLKQAEEELKSLEAASADSARRGEDAELARAHAEISQALAQDDMRDLHDKAMQTATPEDEGIVRNLQAIKRSIEAAEQNVEQTRSAILDIERRRAELERSSERFRRRGYQDPFGGFANANVIGDVIGGILRGALRGTDLDRILDEGFRRQRPARARRLRRRHPLSRRRSLAARPPHGPRLGRRHPRPQGRLERQRRLGRGLGRGRRRLRRQRLQNRRRVLGFLRCLKPHPVNSCGIAHPPRKRGG